MTKWNNQKLSVGMSSIYNAAQDSLAGIKKEMSGLNAQIARLQAQISNASNDSALLSEITQDAASSGIYHLTLAPEQGAWDSRILAATGLPPRDASAFSAVIANIVIAADVGAATSIADTIIEVASTAIPKPKDFFSMPALPSLEAVSIPSIPAPSSPPPENQWISATMGDLFPSLATEMAETASANAAKGNQASAGLDAIIDKQNELNTQLTAAQKLVDDLENSGAYNFIAEPEVTPTNDWYSRLIATEGETDLPDNDISMFSSGTVTVIIAPDYAALVSKFNNYSLKGL